jgi:hypothetical protein
VGTQSTLKNGRIITIYGDLNNGMGDSSGEYENWGGIQRRSSAIFKA